VEQNVFQEFLAKHDEKDWAEVLARLLPSIHPADQSSVRIWFSFWPLKLARELQQSADAAQTVKQLQLDGNYCLAEQVDSSMEYFLGSRYWGGVKQAIMQHAESMTRAAGAGLEEQIRGIASRVAKDKSAEERFVLGVTAVGVMILQQIGILAFAEAAGCSSQIKMHHSAEQLQRLRSGKAGWFARFSSKKKHRVTFDESDAEASFQAQEGQDLSMASSFDPRDYGSKDHRRIAGPIPAECRSGACGYCWIGVLGGRENLSEVTDFERRRLQYFGYAGNAEIGKHHHVRLSCQAKCYGDVSLVIPPWNGVLNGNK